MLMNDDMTDSQRSNTSEILTPIEPMEISQSSSDLITQSPEQQEATTTTASDIPSPQTETDESETTHSMNESPVVTSATACS